MSDHNEITHRLMTERQAVEKIYQAFTLKDPELINDALTPDWADIPLAPGQAPGPEGLKFIINGFIDAFPDVQIIIHYLIQVPGQIAVRAEITGTHKGNFMGIEPTGNFVSIQLNEIHHLNGERTTTTWHMEDWFGLFMQLGQFPPLP